jgi:Na+/H+ antiporter NhaD/arsenite permease-like protein
MTAAEPLRCPPVPLLTGPTIVAAAPAPFWGVGILPFAALLACIAFLPLVPATGRWWHSNRNKLIVSLAAAGLTLLHVMLTQGEAHVGLVLHHAVLDDYLPFILLLLALYVISGGINLNGDLPAHPLTNAALLAFGAAIASFIGTTGASMLLIRPLLHTNTTRRHTVHTVVFFIFLVSNCGGLLLPIGDPPLFLGYLRGVPFTWTLGLWPQWLVCNGILLAVYFTWDTLMHRRETPDNPARDEMIRRPLRLRGWVNLAWLAGVVLAVAFVVPGQPLPGTTFTVFPLLRELLMLGLIGLSLVTTPRGVREANSFSYAAILEVAALFIGIFIAMQVPIDVLKANGAALGLEHPWQFFWATGALSSFLDNAPTYAVFFETADAITLQPGPGVLTLRDGSFIREDLLAAISLGAVFMGAMTYIGNGPNFMVKSIAEQAGVRMPSFFGFLLRYSLPVLVPVFIVVMLLFL